MELELTLGVTGEGVFAVRLELTAGEGADCNRPTGGCESCFAVSGQFTTNSPRLFRSMNFIGGPSLCFPPKRCTETNAFTDRIAIPCLAHTSTNATTNELRVTAQLRSACPGAGRVSPDFDPSTALLIGLWSYCEHVDPRAMTHACKQHTPTNLCSPEYDQHSPNYES